MPTSNKSKLILVTGATGHQGGAAVRALRERGFGVRALTRNPNEPKARPLIGPGTEVTRGDMDDQSSLTRALDGVHGVYSVQNSHESGVEAEIRQGFNVVDAAKRSRITHFVYSSVGSADQRTGIPHFDSKFRIEEHIRGTGMRFTIVRPVFFMENWLGMAQEIGGGTLGLPLAPSTHLQMVAVDDIGGVVASAFERPGRWENRAFELAGDELSMTEIAQVFTRVSGKEVRYVQVPWDEFEQRAGKEMTLMYRWFQNTGYNVNIAAVKQDYPKLTSFERWVSAHWHMGTRAAG